MSAVDLEQGVKLTISQRRYALVLALLTAAITDVMLGWLYSRFGLGDDFLVFWRAVRERFPYAYSPLPFGSPPTALLFLQPLKLLPFWPGYVAWDVISLVAFVWLASRLYGPKAALLGTFSPAIVTALIAGQVTLIVGALVFAAFLCEPILCGFLLGFAVCLKPQMLFLAPLLFLFRREMKPLVAFCATVAGVAAVTTLSCGLSIWTDWLGGMQNLLTVARHRGALNLTISPMSYHPWLGLLSVPLSIYGLYLCRKFPSSYRAAALVATSLFAAPYAMVYDLAPLAVFAAVPILRSSDWKSFGAALTYSGAFGFFSIPFLWPSLQPGSAAPDVDHSHPVGIDPLPLR